MAKFDYESEVVFPDHPFLAAVMYLALMAYPEKDAGLPRGKGAQFAGALQDFSMWAFTKSAGLRTARGRRMNPGYTAPHVREFMGRFKRGHQRIRRRLAAYDLLSTQSLNVLLSFRVASGAPKQTSVTKVGLAGLAAAPETLNVSINRGKSKSARETIAADEPYWSEAFGLNLTGRPADSAQKSKDNYERAFLPSVPVLHLVHGFAECVDELHPSWGGRDPVAAMLMNPDVWIWKALELADGWADGAHFGNGCVANAKLITLIWRGSVRGA